MREHSECEQAYHQALRDDEPGRAEWILTRCDRSHGHVAATETPAPPQPESSEESDDV